MKASVVHIVHTNRITSLIHVLSNNAITQYLNSSTFCAPTYAWSSHTPPHCLVNHRH